MVHHPETLQFRHKYLPYDKDGKKRIDANTAFSTDYIKLAYLRAQVLKPQ